MGVAPSELAGAGVMAMNRYGTLLLFIIGLLGNSISALVFSRPAFRQSTCVLYLLASSLFNLITMIFGVFLRCLIGFNLDLASYSSSFCKIRFYFIYVSQSASLWSIVFACIDRYLSSSSKVTFRRWNNRQKTHRILLLILTFSCLGYAQVFYCFEASIQTAGLCSAKDLPCQFTDTATFLIFNSLLPPTIMMAFGAAMLRNVRQSRRRIGVGIQPVKKYYRRDGHLISMLLVQVALVGVCMLPIALIKLYLTVTISVVKPQQQRDTETFIYQASIVVSYINSSGMFFIYTLTGRPFRAELVRIIGHLSLGYDRYQQNNPRLRPARNPIAYGETRF